MKTTITFLAILLSTMVCSMAMEYPYEAPTARKAIIIRHIKSVKVGMTSKQVTKLMGNPDKTTSLYEPKLMNPSKIGSTMWYIISQNQEHGSVNEKNMVALGIRLDLKNMVTEVHRFKLP